MTTYTETERANTAEQALCDIYMAFGHPEPDSDDIGPDDVSKTVKKELGELRAAADELAKALSDYDCRCIGKQKCDRCKAVLKYRTLVKPPEWVPDGVNTPLASTAPAVHSGE